jgi:hypothetical protein
MSDEKPNPTQRKEIELPIQWVVPDSLVARYANNLIVQHSEHEYIISFFETKPPLIVGEITKEALDSIKSIRATCVAQIIVAKDRFPGFVEAMQANIEKFQSRQKEKQD